jgi:hypothetical protein
MMVFSEYPDLNIIITYWLLFFQNNEADGRAFVFEDMRQPATKLKAYISPGKEWRAPSERIRTSSEIPIEVDLTDEDTIPTYMKISEKVLHLRKLGMSYTSIAERLRVNLWMAKKAARWWNSH